MAGCFGQFNDIRPGSSGQKRKRDMQVFKIYDLIRDCMDAANDQLRTIMEWPDKAINREDTMVQEVITNIESISSLSMEDISKCVVIGRRMCHY